MKKANNAAKAISDEKDLTSLSWQSVPAFPRHHLGKSGKAERLIKTCTSGGSDSL